jgi:hypothetical protein
MTFVGVTLQRSTQRRTAMPGLPASHSFALTWSAGSARSSDSSAKRAANSGSENSA